MYIPEHSIEHSQTRVNQLWNKLFYDDSELVKLKPRPDSVPDSHEAR